MNSFSIYLTFTIVMYCFTTNAWSDTKNSFTEFSDKEAVIIDKLSKHPDQEGLWYQLAKHRSWNKDFPVSNALYEYLIFKNPRNADYFLGLSQSLYWSGNLDQAKSAIDAAYALSPEYVDIIALRNRIHSITPKSSDTKRSIGASHNYSFGYDIPSNQTPHWKQHVLNSQLTIMEHQFGLGYTYANRFLLDNHQISFDYAKTSSSHIYISKLSITTYGVVLPRYHASISRETINSDRIYSIGSEYRSFLFSQSLAFNISYLMNFTSNQYRVSGSSGWMENAGYFYSMKLNYNRRIRTMKFSTSLSHGTELEVAPDNTYKANVTDISVGSHFKLTRKLSIGVSGGYARQGTYYDRAYFAFTTRF